MSKHISELMDGELEAEETRHALNALKREDTREHWDTYHLIGDALRKEPMLSAGFVERVAQRLADEPTVLAPRKPAPHRARNIALSAAASLSAVALVMWTVLQPGTTGSQTEMVASSQPAAPQVAPVAANAGSANVDSYLIAHQEFSPSTAVHGMAPYARTISEAKQEAK